MDEDADADRRLRGRTMASCFCEALMGIFLIVKAMVPASCEKEALL